ncbi:MAG: tRNA-dihydrouridine synthase [Candidatus Pacebacteria bacterium]|nr:tRNA-dihydrouridine synthase [Candidatus Paceibacterota bacterium]
MKSFWQGLPKPFFAMAPMKDVTDAAFRALVARRGAPDVYWTEFVSADGLYHTREIQKMKDEDPTSLGSYEGHRNPLMRDLVYGADQHPIVAPQGHFHFPNPGYREGKLVAPQGHFHFPSPGYREGKLVAQIFSDKPEMIAYAAKLVAELGFDGVDINMGCPDRSVEKQGAGAALIKSPEKARAIIRAAKAASNLPVSVKTRVGYNKETLDEWLPALLEEAPAAITLHLRTRKELSLVSAHWELMKRAVELRDQIAPEVLLIGNGDVTSVAEGKRLAKETRCDGIMIGRGMFGNPWVFAGRTSDDTPLAEKLAALIELAHGFENLSPPKNFAILKKHIKAFVTGFDGAAHFRAKLMEAENVTELEQILKTSSYV